jgi:hypothetical protein
MSENVTYYNILFWFAFILSFWVLYFIFYLHSTFLLHYTLHIAQFADDIAVICKASSSQLAAHHIQNLAEAIDDWCANWRVSVNPTKSKLVQLTYVPSTHKH